MSVKGLHVIFCNKTCKMRNDEKLMTQVTQKSTFFVLECDTLKYANLSDEVGGEAKFVSPSVRHT